MTIRYIADMHFDDADIIAYDNRPFHSVEEMNAAMIQRWNQVAAPEDLTWILGDFCAGSIDRWKELLGALRGKKALILGNHDHREAAECLKDYFEDVSDYREIQDGDRQVILCHYPMFAFHNHYFGACHLYGHVHDSYEWHITENAKRLLRKLYVRDDLIQMTNVGAMLPYMDYRPRTLKELEAYL